MGLREIASKMLRDARLANGLSSAEVSEIVGISERTYQRWESGGTQFGFAEFEASGKALGLTVFIELAPPLSCADSRRQKMIELKSQGRTFRQIALQYGLTKRRVEQICKNPPKPPKPIKAPKPPPPKGIKPTGGQRKDADACPSGHTDFSINGRGWRVCKTCQSIQNKASYEKRKKLNSVQERKGKEEWYTSATTVFSVKN